MSENQRLENIKNWSYKQQILFHAIMEQTAEDVFVSDDSRHHKSNEYDKFAKDVVRGYFDGMTQLQNAGNLMVADSSLSALVDAVGDQLNALTQSGDFYRDQDKVMSKAYFLMTLSLLSVEIPKLPEKVIDEMLDDLQSVPGEHIYGKKMMEWVVKKRDKVIDILAQAMLHDPQQREVYENVKKRLANDKDANTQALDDEINPLPQTYEWSIDRRMLFHAICARLADVLLFEDPEDHQAMEYLKASQDVHYAYDVYVCEQNENEMLNALQYADRLLMDLWDTLHQDFQNYLFDDCKFSERVRILQAINCTVTLEKTLDDNSVDQLLKSIDYDPDLGRYTSDDIFHIKMRAIYMASEAFNEIDRGYDVAPRENNPLLEVYNRIRRGFEKSEGEPESVTSILNLSIPAFYPEDGDAYYQRKVREVFKKIEKNKDIVTDGDYWCLIWIIRGWMYRAALMHDEGVEELAMPIVYNLAVECVTGLSKGIIRTKWDKDSRFRDIVKSLLDDCISLMLLFMEQEDDDYVIKVHRRFRRLEAAMNKSGFRPIDFERIYEYVNIRLL